MRVRLSAESVHNELVHRVEEYSGQDLMACYQCGKCAAGCPVAFAMDMLPSQVIRYAQLGLVDELGVTLVLVGLPLTLAGEMGPQARRVTRYARALAETLDVPLEYHDERYSTVTADELLSEGGRRSRAA